MQLTKRIDRFTLVFVSMALIGLFLGFLGLKHSKHYFEVSTAREKIASIEEASNDTRLKRAGSLEWFSLSSRADCFEDDKIFTGPETTVTITYTSGTKVVLLPNSLVSLSRGYISLSSGSVEVNVKKGSFALEAFGEKIPLTTSEKIRVSQIGSNRTIVSLGAPIKSLARTELNSLVKVPSIQLTAPETGESIIRFPGSKIFFSWKLSSNLPLQNFLLEISPSGDFSTEVFSRTLFNRYLQLPVENLSPGVLHWRITETSTGQTVQSTFMLDPDVAITPVEPQPRASYSLPKLIQENFDFDWKAKHPLKQRIQLANDENFTQLLLDVESLPPHKAPTDIVAGKFFWRVGYVLSKKHTHWSGPWEFEVKPQAPPLPLVLTTLPSPLDFSLTPEYVLNIRDRNKCKSYELILKKASAEILRLRSESPEFVLKSLKDGDYTLEVKGTLTDGRETTSQQFIKVKNSPPVPAPVIKNKKSVKLIVRALQMISDFLFAPAMAQDEAAPKLGAFYTLKWEGSENGSYEVEISRQDKSVLLKEETTETSYKFFVPGPQKFFWRVRTKVGNRWSEFSDYGEIDILDKVVFFKETLMLSPKNGKELIVESHVKEFPLTWKEVPGYDYLLEVFGSARSTKPSFSLKLKTPGYTLQFKKIPPKFYWRVTPVSSFGNKGPAPKPFSVVITRKPEVPIRYQLQPAILFSQTKFTQDYQGPEEVKENVDFAGLAYNFSGEYFLKSSNYHRSFAFEGRYGTYKESVDSLTDTRLLLEYGWLSDPFGKETHNFHLGYLLHTVDFKFGDLLSATYLMNFVSGKYSWIRIWSKKSLLEITGSLLVTVPPQDFTPSFLIKPVFHYRLNRDWWMITLAMFERYTAKGVVEVEERKSDMTIHVQNLSVGVGISYRPE